MRIFLTPISIIFLNPKILGFLSLRKQHYLGVKCKKLTLRKSYGIYWISFETVHEWNGHFEICSRPQAIGNFRHYIQGVLHPGVLQAGVLRAGVLHSGVFRPRVLHPEILQAEAYRPGVLQAGVLRAGALRPGVFRPEVLHPGVL